MVYDRCPLSTRHRSRFGAGEVSYGSLDPRCSGTETTSECVTITDNFSVVELEAGERLEQFGK
jgi:hypothetical protein